MSAASFLLSSFLQAINAVMLWPVHVQNVPQASEHLCPTKLQTRCDIFCAFTGASLSNTHQNCSAKCIDFPLKKINDSEFYVGAQRMH